MYQLEESIKTIAKINENNIDNALDTKCEHKEYDDGKYYGEVDENGKPNGLGIYNYEDGKYIGFFNSGKKNEGIYVFGNGDTYMGQFKDNKQEGIGIYQMVNGRI